MVTIETVYDIHDTVAPLRAILYVPGGCGMVTLLLPEGCVLV